MMGMLYMVVGTQTMGLIFFKKTEFMALLSKSMKIKLLVIYLPFLPRSIACF